MSNKILSFVALIALLTSCYKKPDDPTEIPVTKDVQFRIGLDKDYSLPIYDGLKAELKLSMVKESIIDGKILVAWDTTFSLRSIRDYPVNTTPIVVSKQFYGVWQSIQVVRVSHVIKYVHAAGQISQSALGETIPTSVASKQVFVNL
jgi:hypothetical protein